MTFSFEYVGVHYANVPDHMASLRDCMCPGCREMLEPYLADTEGNSVLPACDMCGNATEREDLHRVADRYARTRACESCITYCSYCNGWYEYAHGEVSCSECGEDYCDYDNPLRYHDDHDCYYCPDCMPEPESVREIHYYSWRPPEFIPKGDPHGVMMGVELEVNGRAQRLYEAMAAIDDTDQHLYAKYDGSVNGVEIVTHPFTLQWAREEFDYPALLENLRNAGGSVNDGVGMHVHVARNAFSKGRSSQPVHAMRWLAWITGVAAPHLDGGLARRRSSSWASFTSDANNKWLAQKARGPFGTERYVAVNCLNHATFELRFFQSTLDDTEFFAAIEFATASVEFTRQLRSSDMLHGRASWAEFYKYAQANGYENLVQEMERTTTLNK